MLVFIIILGLVFTIWAILEHLLDDDSFGLEPA